MGAGGLRLFPKKVFHLDFCCVFGSPVPLPQWYLTLLKERRVSHCLFCSCFSFLNCAFDFYGYVSIGGEARGRLLASSVMSICDVTAFL